MLIKRKSKLKPKQAEKVEDILYISDNIRSAYYSKELFYTVIDCDNLQEVKKLMCEWIMIAQASRLKYFKNCASTLQNWASSILNPFDYPYINGFTESCNNKIKVLKRNTYGYSNFERFGNRILHMFNYKKDSIEKAVAMQPPIPLLTF